MRTPTRLALAFIALLVCACAAGAQEAAHAQSSAQSEPLWVAVSPAGEGFTASMPKQPDSAAQQVRANGLDADGILYSASADERTTFYVWSMKGTVGERRLGSADYSGPTFSGGVAYLDDADDLAWELLIAPELERLGRRKLSVRELATINVQMAYAGEFKLSGMPAREYRVSLEKAGGVAYVCAEGARVYVVAALGADEQDPRLNRFLASFVLKSAAGRNVVDTRSSRQDVGVGTGTGPGVGYGPGRGYNVGGGQQGNAGVGDPAVDYGKPFRSNEVTKKAVITAKPEPGFTEPARKFNVTGTVRLRATLSATGEVNSIVVVKGLPHGLTEKAVAAARQIRFTPAQKDGRQVSQYVILDYNFNIY
jgi:TonB family protein